MTCQTDGERVFTRVLAEVDFSRDGKQVGRLLLPHSHDDSAWGAVAVPIIVVSNGGGPTLLLCGGVHGDEYEGQIALLDLAKRLELGAIRGRVIIIPALNTPACRAGTRTSPIDGRDLNRCFPGDPNGSLSPMLAHWLARVLLPMCDTIVDLHSGGRSLECLPCTMSHILDDMAVMRRAFALASAFGAPLHVMNREVDGAQTFASAAESLGKTYISSELGGGNRVSLDGLQIARRGIRNAMRHVGVIEGALEAPAVPTRAMLIPARSDYGFAPRGGIYEPLRALGTSVKAGEPVGAIHDVDDPLAAATQLTACRDGLLWCQRGQGRIAEGDCTSVVVIEWAGAPR